METTTLYYYFSTIAQVMAAISALLAVFAHFKINEIKEFLVGDGKATLERMSLTEKGYNLGTPDFKKYHDRLRDAIGRKSIKGIFEVIKILATNAINKGETAENSPRGFQYLESRFSGRIKQISEIKTLTKTSIILSFIAIFISIISLVLVEILIKLCFINWIIIIIVLLATVLSMIFTIRGIFKGLQDQEDV